MTRPLPYGGQAIADLRAIRKRPADMVLVSLIGPLREINPVVTPRPEKLYDWRFLAGLEVMVIADMKIEQALIVQTLEAIERVVPDYLGAWFTDKQDGSNVLIEGYKPHSKAMRRMELIQRTGYAGLGSALPAEECLKQIASEAKTRAMQNAHYFDSSMVEFAQDGFRQIFGQAWGDI